MILAIPSGKCFSVGRTLSFRRADIGPYGYCGFQFGFLFPAMVIISTPTDRFALGPPLKRGLIELPPPLEGDGKTGGWLREIV